MRGIWEIETKNLYLTKTCSGLYFGIFDKSINWSGSCSLLSIICSVLLLFNFILLLFVIDIFSLPSADIPVRCIAVSTHQTFYICLTCIFVGCSCFPSCGEVYHDTILDFLTFTTESFAWYTHAYTKRWVGLTRSDIGPALIYHLSICKTKIFCTEILVVWTLCDV